MGAEVLVLCGKFNVCIFKQTPRLNVYSRRGIKQCTFFTHFKMKWKLVLLTAVIATLTNCSSRLSPYLPYNRYLLEFNYHVVNDSLQLYLKTPADILFIKDKKSIYKELKNNNLRFANILVCGKAKYDPYYEFFITYNSNKLTFKNPAIIQFDTTINTQKYTLICLPLDDNETSYKVDSEFIFKSLVVGDNYRREVVTLNEVLEKYTNCNRFYQALTEINDFPSYDKSEESFKLQMQLTYASFLGANNVYYDLLNKWQVNYKLDSLTEQVINEKSIKGFDQVRSLIINASQNYKLVMFNENHFFPNHRKLLLQLLKDFRNLGFNYLALETLSGDSALNAGNPLTLESGFYTREPIYSELIRTAQNLGFKFVSYENFNPSSNREVTQAENFYNQTFKVDSLAKVVALAGISHIFETTDNSAKHWMASIFKEKYDIDPLTFNQTSLNHYCKAINDDIAIIKSSDLNSKDYNTTDWQIVNNLALLENSGNFEYKNEYDETIQLSIFLDSELAKLEWIDNMVPYRSFLLQKGEIYHTKIPSQKYRFVILDKNGKILKDEIIAR
jgi:hypothetical protein